MTTKSAAYWRAEANAFCKRALAAETEAFGAREKLARAYQENDALVAQYNEMDEQLAAAIARAEAAEAKLAAVPVDAIRRVYLRDIHDAPEDTAAIEAWLFQQSEVQP